MSSSPDPSIDRRPLCRRTVEQLARALPAELELATLAEERDQQRFCNRLFAALHAGRDVPAEVLVAGASLVDDPLLLAAVVARVTGDVDAAAVGAMDDGRIVGTWVGASLLFCTACRLRQQGAPASRDLVRWTKWLARRAADDDTLATVLAITELLDEPSLATLVQSYDTPEWREVAQENADWLVSAFTGSVMQVVPELPPAPRRVGAKVGRNDKCPCGSGRKYKKCCEGKPLQLAPQTLADLEQTPVADLARLDPRAVPVALRATVARDLLAYHEFAAGLRWREAVDDADERLELLTEAVERLCSLGRVVQARRLATELPGDRVPVDLEVRGATPARGIKALERVTADLLDDDPLAVATAALASPFPAVGIVMARGVIADPDLPDEDRLAVLLALHDRRDREGWWPWDRAGTWSLTDDRGPSDDVVAQHAAARRHAESAYTKAERARRRLEGELARALAQLEAAPARTVEEQQLDAVRDELARLKADHKRVHDERNALRRELRELAELDAVPDDDGADEAADVVDDDDDDEVAAAMGVRRPLLPDDFADVLARVPLATQRTTMQRLGELCSGRQAGWRDTKRLLGFDNLWRVRIGRSYRLLYRVREETLQVVDLVHRQELEKKLHKLQALR